MKTCKEALTSKASRKPTKEDFLELIHEQECTEVITDLAEEVENGILEENSQSQELWWSLDYSKEKLKSKLQIWVIYSGTWISIPWSSMTNSDQPISNTGNKLQM